MLIRDAVGSDGSHGGLISRIFGAVDAPSSCSLMLKSTCSSSSSSSIGIPMLVPPSHSHPPAFLHHPCSPSLSHSPAPYPTKALLYIYSLHVIPCCHCRRPIHRRLWCPSRYFSPSHSQMSTDIGSLYFYEVIDVLSTCIWLQFTSMLMWDRLGRSEWGWGQYLGQRRHHWGVTVIVVDGSQCFICRMGLRMVLPHWRAYAQSVGEE